MGADLIDWLIEATALISAAIVIALAVRWILNRLFGARAAILLWALVPLALAATLLPDPVVGSGDARSPANLTFALDRIAAGAGLHSGSAAAATGIELTPIITFWIAGGMLTLMLMARRQRRFRRQLGPMRRVGKRLYRAAGCVPGPLVVGAISPRIILPADFLARFSSRQRRLMLAHEYTHLKRLDPIWNLVAAALRCLFWFNPLTHLAAARFRRDQELACDARVLDGHWHRRRVYAGTLLALGGTGEPLPVLTFGPHPLKERIMNLSSSNPPSIKRRRVGALIAFGLALTLAWSAWAATPRPAEDPAGGSSEPELFAFDAEVTVGDRTKAGSLTLQGDESHVPLDGGRPTMLAHNRLVLKHQDEESGWSAEIVIERIDDGEFEGRFNVNATIVKDGETVATPRMIVSGESPAWVESTDPETGALAYRVKLIPVDTDGPDSHQPALGQ